MRIGQLNRAFAQEPKPRGRRLRALLQALAAVLVLGAPALAQDDKDKLDGLDEELRTFLYNPAISVVVRIDLKQVGHDAVLQAFKGMFEPSEYLAFLEVNKEFPNELDKLLKPTMAVPGLLLAEYTSLTMVVQQGAGAPAPAPFALLELPFRMNQDLFDRSKGVIAGALSEGGIAADLNLKGSFVLIGPPNASPLVMPHSQGVEDAILLALQQIPGTPAAAFVSPVSEAVRTQIAVAAASAPDFAAAIGQADYMGGYASFGPNPQLHFFVRFSGEPAAANLKTLYDNAWQAQIAAAEAAEKKQQEGPVVIEDLALISESEMDRRLSAAMPVHQFGQVVQLDLDTLALHQITSALIDRNFRRRPSE